MPTRADSLNAPKRLVPWVEKYRPKKVQDVSHQEEVVKALKTSIETGNVPHLLFYGPPGTGKTSTILALAHELYGEHYSDRVLELNASDERGISVVRDKVKGFASTTVATKHIDGKKLPPFKLIILDECDSMSDDAQSALRRTMELYTRVTRFCLVCNYVSRIIEPLASRCAKFRFEPLSKDSFTHKIESISRLENVQLADGTLDTIVKVSKGDMRAGITLLQTSSQYTNGQVTPEVVTEMAGLPSDEFLEMIWDSVKSPKFSKVEECADELQAEGYSLATILRVLQQQLLDGKLEGFSDLKVAKSLVLFAQVDKAIEDGGDEHLQFSAMLAELQSLFRKKG